jgi:hypothetical protein
MICDEAISPIKKTSSHQEIASSQIRHLTTITLMAPRNDVGRMIASSGGSLGCSFDYFQTVNTLACHAEAQPVPPNAGRDLRLEF